MKHSLRNLLLISTPIIVIIGVFFVSSRKAEQPALPKAAITPITINIDWIPSPEYYGLFYAKESGIFAHYGFDVTIESGAGAPTVSKQLAVNAISFGTTTSDNVLREIEQGARFIACVPLLRFNPCSIVYHKSKQIHTAKDCGGMRIGTNQQSAVYNQFLAILAQGGLTPADIKEYPIGWGGPAEFATDKVDAILAYTTNAVVDLEQQGLDYNEKLFGDFGIQSYGLVFVVAAGAPAKSGLEPEAIERLILAVIEGYNKGGKDPNISAEALLKAAPTLDRAKLLRAIAKIDMLNRSTSFDLSKIDLWLKPEVSASARSDFQALICKQYGGRY